MSLAIFFSGTPIFTVVGLDEHHDKAQHLINVNSPTPVYRISNICRQPEASCDTIFNFQEFWHVIMYK